jgi:hypothetical protein
MTVDDNPVPLITLPKVARINHLIIHNNGPNGGFFSADGGNTWSNLHAASGGKIGVAEAWDVTGSSGVLVRRVTGAGNLSEVFGRAEFCPIV